MDEHDEEFRFMSKFRKVELAHLLSPPLARSSEIRTKKNCKSGQSTFHCCYLLHPEFLILYPHSCDMRQREHIAYFGFPIIGLG